MRQCVCWGGGGGGQARDSPAAPALGIDIKKDVDEFRRVFLFLHAPDSPAAAALGVDIEEDLHE
jgi:hypothetical protein